MILPAISILVTPFVVAGNLILDPVYFDYNMWLTVLQSGGISSISGLGFMLAFEVLGHSLLLAFSLLVMVQFLQKRTSLPKLMVALMAGEILFSVLDVIGVNLALGPETGDEAATDQLGALTTLIIHAGIWMPYFLTSSRVKQTFINRRSTEIAAKTGFID